MTWALALLAWLLGAEALAQDFERGPRNTDFPPAFAAQFRAPLVDSGTSYRAEVFADGLAHPWGIAALPSGGFLVTERPGRLRYLSETGALSKPISGLPEVAAQGQGGLLDVAVAPDFAHTRELFWTYAARRDGGFVTAAAKGRLTPDRRSVEAVEVFFTQVPSASAPMHFGSRVLFDGAGHVFVTTGEHFTESYRQLAQDPQSSFGKVLRFTRSGAPAGVGMAGAVEGLFSLGHRNIQGAMMRGDVLWTIEHGPRGGDELNLTQAGKNYGWPVISYGENYSGAPVGEGIAVREGLEQPRYFWDPVIAPAGMITYEGAAFPGWAGDVLIGSLNPGGIVRLRLVGDEVVEEERLSPDLGRVRDLEVDAAGRVLVLIDADPGRILRLVPD